MRQGRFRQDCADAQVDLSPACWRSCQQEQFSRDTFFFLIGITSFVGFDNYLFSERASSPKNAQLAKMHKYNRFNAGNNIKS